LADPGIVFGMTVGAPHGSTVVASVGRPAWTAAADAAGIDAAMDRPERWCGEGREDERVRYNVSRDTFLFAPGQPGGDEEVGVTAIPLRTRRTP
jgi:hypothetical protein